MRRLLAGLVLVVGCGGGSTAVTVDPFAGKLIVPGVYSFKSTVQVTAVNAFRYDTGTVTVTRVTPDSLYATFAVPGFYSGSVAVAAANRNATSDGYTFTIPTPLPYPFPLRLFPNPQGPTGTFGMQCVQGAPTVTVGGQSVVLFNSFVCERRS